MLPHHSFNDLSTFLSCHLEYSHSAPPARSTRKRGLHSKRSFNQSFCIPYSYHSFPSFLSITNCKYATYNSVPALQSTHS